MYRGNRLPHPDRHTNPNAPLGRDLGRISPIAACELCGWARNYPTMDAANEDRRTHLIREHGPELQRGDATIHLVRGGRHAC